MNINVLFEALKSFAIRLSVFPDLLFALLGLRDSFDMSSINYLFLSEISGIPLWLIYLVGTIVTTSGTIIAIVELIKKIAK